MADLTTSVTKPGYLGSAPTYVAVTAADKFAAQSGGRYMLHYKNGATPQATGGLPNKVTNPTAVAPAGSSPAAGWADVVTQATPGMGATSENVVWLDNVTPLKDGTGFVNLVHPGTLTTVTVAIMGPF
jgi:predicted transcriptional regulator of viral defense system